MGGRGRRLHRRARRGPRPERPSAGSGQRPREAATGAFKLAHGAKFGKAVAKVTKGPGSKATGLVMAFKLIEAAQQRWRAVNAPHLVASVRAGARLERGRLVERPQQQAAA